MTGAGALDYSQVISDAKGALNKFLLIFQSISIGEQMGKSILPYCIQRARFSAGLDGFARLRRQAAGHLPGLHAGCATGPLHVCSAVAACAAAAIVQRALARPLQVTAAWLLETCMKCWVEGETHVWRGRLGFGMCGGPWVVLFLNESFHLMC